MSTHITRCIVCGKDIYCTSDVHALGCGGQRGEGGCENPPYIEFCSEECLHELERRMSKSWKNYLECKAIGLEDTRRGAGVPRENA
jgi:hypothetical protein